MVMVVAVVISCTSNSVGLLEVAVKEKESSRSQSNSAGTEA